MLNGIPRGGLHHHGYGQNIATRLDGDTLGVGDAGEDEVHSRVAGGEVQALPERSQSEIKDGWLWRPRSQPSRLLHHSGDSTTDNIAWTSSRALH